MILRHSPNSLAATLLLLTAISSYGAQTAPPPAPQTPSSPAQPAAQAIPQSASALPRQLPPFYRNLILLDPAHGGPDTGAHLPDSALEKDVDLAFAQRLRPALAAQGFTVLSTRDSDPSADLPSDQRAGAANHARPLACILMHATATGSGIHIATSALPPLDGQPSASRALPWQTAQAATMPMSLRLANEIGLALVHADLPIVLLRASVPPIDNLTCAAVSVEIAPLKPKTGTPSAVTNAAYQQRIAEAIAAGLASFRTHNAPAPSPGAAPPPPAPRPAAPAPKPPAPETAKPPAPTGVPR